MSIAHMEQSTCPNCNGQVEKDPKRGETACPECGTIIHEEAIDHGPEWRSFSDETDQKGVRVGTPETQTIHDKGLSTQIGWQNRDANGNTLSPKKKSQLSRLRKWDNRCKTYGSKDRNLKQALSEIDRMSSALGLPRSTREVASVIYRRAYDKSLLPGRSIESVATGVVYAAARKEGIPRTLDEVAAVSRVEYERIARAYRAVATELALAIEPTNPTAYLPRFASALDCSETVHRQAREMLESIAGTSYPSGKSPVALAAAALYASACLTGERVTQQEISEVSGVTCMTIRTHYREFLTTDE